MHSLADRQKSGRRAPVTALGSGMPAGYLGLMEGLTFRAVCPAGIDGLPVNQLAAEPAPGFPTTVEAVVETFVLSGAIVTPCAGESNCWQITPDPEGDGFFSITNTSTCWQSGYAASAHELMPSQTDPKTGFPPGWEGTGEATQLRPCAE